MQNNANPPAAGSPTTAPSADGKVVASAVRSAIAESARTELVRNGSGPMDVTPPLGQTPPNGDGSLARQRDEAYERMLEAVDALRGAQAEQAAARARVAELEHQVHIYSAENEFLRSRSDDQGPSATLRHLAAAVRSRRQSK